ncbi:MAG: hypothetical protein U0176_06300 [Bacteroidia bacterium]
MRYWTKKILVTGLAVMMAALAARAQSDSQTLRSPYASVLSMTDFDFGLPLAGNLNYPLSLGAQTVVGYQFNRIFTAGIGVAIQGYGPSDMLLLPIFADARLHFPQRKWTPFVSLDAGYSISLGGGDRKGGLLVSPGVGGRIPIANNLAFSFGLGLRWQLNQGPYNGETVDYRSEYLSAKVGIAVRFPKLLSKMLAPRMKDRKGDK